MIDEGDRVVENSKDREIHPYELVHAAAPSNSHTAKIIQLYGLLNCLLTIHFQSSFTQRPCSATIFPERHEVKYDCRNRLHNRSVIAQSANVFRISLIIIRVFVLYKYYYVLLLLHTYIYLEKCIAHLPARAHPAVCLTRPALLSSFITYKCQDLSDAITTVAGALYEVCK